MSSFSRLSREELLARIQSEQPDWPEDEYGPWVEAAMRLDPRFPQYGLGGYVRPWREIFTTVPGPVLILAGDPRLGSIVSDEEEAEAVALLGDRGRVLRVPGAGHSVRRGARQPFLEHVRAWLAAVDGRRGRARADS